MNDTVSFLVKVTVLSAALSLLIKYGGRWLPLPYTEQLNSSVTLIVLLPSLAIGLGLLSLLKKGR
jgi:ABC-type Fe3+ transport system permease subunit